MPVVWRRVRPSNCSQEATSRRWLGTPSATCGSRSSGRACSTRASATLVPAATIRRLAVGSDHVGLALRRELVAWLRGRGLAVDDIGTHTPEAVDYPDIAAAVALPVSRGEADAGIVIDGAGLGSAIVANKIRGVRAVMATTPLLARYGREHNGANVLALGATLVSAADARQIIETFLTTPMTEPRYIKRLAKVKLVEDQGRMP